MGLPTRSAILPICLAVALSLGGCEIHRSSPDETTDGDQELLSLWEFSSYGVIGDETPIIAGTFTTAEFTTEGRVSGSSGCKNYMADYEISDQCAMTISNIVQSFTVCDSIEGLVEQEQAYVSALGSVSSFEVGGGSLKLFYDGGEKNLVFALFESD